MVRNSQENPFSFESGFSVFIILFPNYIPLLFFVFDDIIDTTKFKEFLCAQTEF